MSFLEDVKANGQPGSCVLRQLSYYRPTRKIVYRCLGIAAFVAACVPANIVAWIYLCDAENHSGISMSLTKANSSISDSVTGGGLVSNLTLEVINFIFLNDHYVSKLLRQPT